MKKCKHGYFEVAGMCCPGCDGDYLRSVGLDPDEMARNAAKDVDMKTKEKYERIAKAKAEQKRKRMLVAIAISVVGVSVLALVM